MELFKNINKKLAMFNRAPALSSEMVTAILALQFAERDLQALRHFVSAVGFNPQNIIDDLSGKNPSVHFLPTDCALKALVFSRDFSKTELSSVGQKNAAAWLDSISTQ